MIKNNNLGGFIDRQRKGVEVGVGLLADVFENDERKNKTMSVYRLLPFEPLCRVCLYPFL